VFAGIVGVKSYPKGVTTNSDSGIEDYRIYYPVFEAMQDEGLVLCIHGEVPSSGSTCVMNAERHFLKHLAQLHQDFPRLKIVLEHATTKEAVELVKQLGETVGCTITAHHLYLICDDWAGSPIHYCKPVAKYPEDREALRQIVKSGHPRFFLGSDSAPHLVHKKTLMTGCAAGIFTSMHLSSYLAHVFDEFGALDKLKQFATEFGRQFYGHDTLIRAAQAQWPHLSPQQLEDQLIKDRPVLKLKQETTVIPPHIVIVESKEPSDKVIPFMASQTLNYGL
jgi:dihydroorotase